MSFVISGLPAETFKPLFGLSDAELAVQGVVRCTVDSPNGFPCRVTLEDATPGETVLLLNFEHMALNSPFRASHAIYVREGDHPTTRVVDEVPPALLRRRHVSLRAFDSEGMLLAAEVTPGPDTQPPLERLLALPGVAFVQLHNAAHGCFLAQAEQG